MPSTGVSVRHALCCAAVLSLLQATDQFAFGTPAACHLRHRARIVAMATTEPGTSQAAEPALAAAPAAAPPPSPPAGLKPLLTDNMPKLKPSKIRRGDFIVHSAYGVGRFEGVYNNPRIGKMLRVQFRDDYLEVHPMQRGDIKLFKRKEEACALRSQRPSPPEGGQPLARVKSSRSHAACHTCEKAVTRVRRLSHV